MIYLCMYLFNTKLTAKHLKKNIDVAVLLQFVVPNSSAPIHCHGNLTVASFLKTLLGSIVSFNMFSKQ